MKIDVTQMIGALRREVDSGEREGKPVRVVRALRVYDTSRDDLWDALTNPERLPRWFLPVSGDLRLGGRYALEGNASGTIIRCEPPKHLALSWEFGGSVSWVDVTLHEVDAARTRLELEHAAEIDDHWKKYGPGATGVGWELALMGLALHLASGAAVDPKAFQAWSASDEGKRLITESSEGWGNAAIAAGDDEATARASAARTTAAYTGAGGDPI